MTAPIHCCYRGCTLIVWAPGETGPEVNCSSATCLTCRRVALCLPHFETLAHAARGLRCAHCSGSRWYLCLFEPARIDAALRAAVQAAGGRIEARHSRRAGAASRAERGGERAGRDAAERPRRDVDRDVIEHRDDDPFAVHARAVEARTAGASDLSARGSVDPESPRRRTGPPPLPTQRAVAARADAARMTAARADASRADASRADASRADASRADASRADGSRAGANRAGANRADANHADASRADANRAPLHGAVPSHAATGNTATSHLDAARQTVSRAIPHRTAPSPIAATEAAPALARSAATDAETLRSRADSSRADVRRAVSSGDRADARRVAPTNDRADTRRAAPTNDRADPHRAAPTNDRADARHSAPANDRADARRTAPTSDRADPHRTAPTSDHAIAHRAVPADDRAGARRVAPTSEHADTPTNDRADTRRAAPNNDRADPHRTAPTSDRTDAARTVEPPSDPVLHPWRWLPQRLVPADARLAAPGVLLRRLGAAVRPIVDGVALDLVLPAIDAVARAPGAGTHLVIAGRNADETPCLIWLDVAGHRLDLSPPRGGRLISPAFVDERRFVYIAVLDDQAELREATLENATRLRTRRITSLGLVPIAPLPPPAVCQHREAVVTFAAGDGGLRPVQIRLADGHATPLDAAQSLPRCLVAAPRGSLAAWITAEGEVRCAGPGLPPRALGQTDASLLAIADDGAAVAWVAFGHLAVAHPRSGEVQTRPLPEPIAGLAWAPRAKNPVRAAS